MSHGCFCNFTNIVGFRLYRLIVEHNLKNFICNTNFKEHNLTPLPPRFKNIKRQGQLPLLPPASGDPDYGNKLLLCGEDSFFL